MLFHGPYAALFALVCCVTALARPEISESKRENQPGGLVRRVSDGDFVRRMFHGSFVIDKALYIDGGEYTARNGSTYAQLILNQTLVVDLSTSFSTSIAAGATLNLSVIEKASCPNLNQVRFWSDPASRSVYAYGGEFSYLNPWTGGATVPLESLWKFVPLTSGPGGHWEAVDTSSDPVWRGLTRASGGSAASGPIGGFNVGGYANSRTSQSTNIGGVIPIPGLQFYNFSSKAWTNDSALGYTYEGTSVLGGAVYIDTWGPEGIVVFMGGQTTRRTDEFIDGQQYIPLTNITIYEPVSRTWYHQAATGEIPSQRDRFCVVGAQGGDNSTYEVFLYGGQYGPGAYSSSSQTANALLDEVYILSLPSFTWNKANYTPSDPRIVHTCHRIGRQMLSVGGLNPGVPGDRPFEATINLTDSFAQGIKVFDLTDLVWTNRWDASMPEYKIPSVVKAAGAIKPTWNDPRLGDVFDPPPANGSTNSKNEKGKSNAGTMAGAVVGGICGLAIVAGLVWYFLKPGKKEDDPMDPQAGLSEMESTQPELLGSKPLPAEMESTGASQPPAELGDAGASPSPVELEGSRSYFPSPGQ